MKRSQPSKPAVVLLSGGLDSATTLAVAGARGHGSCGFEITLSGRASAARPRYFASGRVPASTVTILSGTRYFFTAAFTCASVSASILPGYSSM